MNNNQFRNLVLDTPARQSSGEEKSKNGAAGPSATPSLGSRMKSSIPMTPRSIKGYSSSNEFARQLAAQNASTLEQKKFRSTAAPKGAKLADGYVDRVKMRESEEEENEKVTRIKSLEEMMKLQQIDEATFVKLREEILGDDVKGRAGLVKGLDMRLLERARRGEVGVMDVLEDDKQPDGEGEGSGKDEDVDDKFDELERIEVTAVKKEEVKKKGEMAPPALTGRKRNRNQILEDMKAARLAAKEAAQPSLGSKFRKIGERSSESRIERDAKGREVLITIDEHGNEKRKVRKAPLNPEPKHEKGYGLLMPDKDAKPLGMEVPEIPNQQEEEEKQVNIFDDVESDYDPLAGLEDEASSSDEDGEVSESKGPPKSKPPEAEKKIDGSMQPPPKPTAKPRNYFGDTSTTPEIDPSKPAALSDLTIMAALKKASSLNLPTSSSTAKDDEEAAKAARHKKMLQRDDRDAEDMDMGFGSSRFDDQDDAEEGGEGKRIKLSEWGKDGDDDGDEKKGDKGKRKRGPKKKKGNGESAKDVLGVLERRKQEG
ncbi:hypothetical protein BJ875DRAFT_418051 [Amylocarpus encephaloides]|uniref:RED-like N-terminal domain-containing protein n=1 Tax=Amylocarpus encephaloides TaxID=45428 RepID=A0A9P7YQP0_9HELO|nr:hypothetical protein BJ875DRAFT_418051 [Amylocarpus encephaloides]